MRFLTIALLGVVLAPSAWSQPKLSCPASITVTESAAPAPGWKTSASQTPHAFERVSVYNGTAGGQEFELAPDTGKDSPAGKIVQTWNLADYRSMNIFLRCRYHDTSVTLLADVPAALKTCTFFFTLTKQNAIVGKSSLLCQ